MDLNILEKRCLDGFRENRPFPSGDPTDPEAWLEFSLGSALTAAATVRDLDQALGVTAEIKPDGSPATELERKIEDKIRSDLGAFAPDAEMVGEESGGELKSSGFTVAVDPIDGTWAFLTQTESYTVTVNVFRDGAPFVGVVANPATGEVAYVGPEGPPRLIRIGLLGRRDQAVDLPLRSTQHDKPLVHIHPNSNWRSMVDGLYRAWEGREVQMVRSPGGSPAWSLVEAAKGDFVYANRWSGRPVEPWDLVGGVEIVRRAGGEVVNLQGEPIDALRHSGPFIAGLFPRDRDRVAEIINRSEKAST